MLIELTKGFFVNPETVAVVKATDEDACALFTCGQSAVDGGFHLPYSAESVAVAIDDEEELDEEDEGEEDGDEDEDEEDGNDDED
jgi:hypothetical protein